MQGDSDVGVHTEFKIGFEEFCVTLQQRENGATISKLTSNILVWNL
jgi:hypothetical protein